MKRLFLFLSVFTALIIIWGCSTDVVKPEYKIIFPPIEFEGTPLPGFTTKWGYSEFATKKLFIAEADGTSDAKVDIRPSNVMFFVISADTAPVPGAATAAGTYSVEVTRNATNANGFITNLFTATTGAPSIGTSLFMRKDGDTTFVGSTVTSVGTGATVDASGNPVPATAAVGTGINGETPFVYSNASMTYSNVRSVKIIFNP